MFSSYKSWLTKSFFTVGNNIFTLGEKLSSIIYFVCKFSELYQNKTIQFACQLSDKIINRLIFLFKVGKQNSRFILLIICEISDWKTKNFKKPYIGTFLKLI
jgi:hypothetical protein